MDFLHRGPHIGRAPRAITRNVHQRIGLFRPKAQHAAWPVIFERAARQVHAIGQERRGQRVAFDAGHRLAVKGETDRLCALFWADAEGFGHFAPPFSLETSGFASPAL